ncbi:BTE_collapsed_G0004120.mRNA.1.CDS.1 [Saccharomyces cerevisiae]|nr:BTE_collapsed_G0004120.mRNA.1.CDS.1 [Saccharomyces cerevisiae]
MLVLVCQYSFSRPLNPALYVRHVCALDLTTPTDLVSFGLIPELIGRVPIITALQPLQFRGRFQGISYFIRTYQCLSLDQSFVCLFPNVIW